MEAKNPNAVAFTATIGSHHVVGTIDAVRERGNTGVASAHFTVSS